MNLRSTTAGEVMTPEVVTTSGKASLREAIKSMKENRLQALVVQPEHLGDGIGIVTIKDIVGVLDSEDPDAEILDELNVSDVMTRPMICTHKGLGIHDCVSLMRMTGVRRLAVMDGAEIVGMLSYTDIFNLIASRA